MDKYDVMRSIEGLEDADREEVLRWAIRTFSPLKGESPSRPKGLTIKERVLAVLTDEPTQLREIVEAVYGEYNASKRQLVHSRLRELMDDGYVVRPAYGRYSRAAATTADEEEAS